MRHINLCTLEVVLLLILSALVEFIFGGINNLHTYDTSRGYDIANDIFFEITKPHELEYTYRLKPAKDFGGSFKAEEFKQNKENVMIMVQPIDACTPLSNGPELYGRIALISRGGCTFVQKVGVAENAGAIGAIVTDIRSSTYDDFLIEMVHDNSTQDIKIPAAYLLGRDGRIIVAALQNSGLDRAYITLPLNVTFTPPELINHPPWAMT